MSVQVFGLAAFRAAVARGIALAERADRCLRERPKWEVVTPAQLGVVTFRYLAPGRSAAEIDELNAGIARASLADGFAAVSTTGPRGRTVLRLCTINPRTTDDDIADTVDRLARFGDEPAARGTRT